MPILRCLAVALVLATAPAVASGAATDIFEASHRAGVAVNQPRGFEIRFKDGRSTFNPREPIDIELVFDPPDGVYDGLATDPCRGWLLADVVFDHRRGVQEPQRALCDPEGLSFGVPGCVPGGVLGGPKRPPLVITLTLNTWYRFDQPGTFRLFIRSAHLIGYASALPRQTSNILTFTITARDARYEKTRLGAVAAAFDDRATPIEGRRAAFRELTRLASNDADSLVARILHTDADHGLYGALAAALYMAPDHVATIAALRRELRRRDREIAPQFVRDLAALQVWHERGVHRSYAEARYREVLAGHAADRARVVSARPGALQAAFAAELREGGGHERLPYAGALAAAATRYPVEVSAAFRALAPERQRNLLLDSWRWFDSPRFRPLVGAVFRETPGDDPFGLRDIALVRWHALAPRAARAAALDDLARVPARASAETLGRVLGDVAVAPTVEASWRGTLGMSGDRAALISAAERLERFGSAASAADVTAAWERRWRDLPAEASAAAIAFLLRVDPASGQRALATALAGSAADRADSWEGGLLRRVGTLEWSPSLEGPVTAALAHRDEVVRYDAIALLETSGSPAVKGALAARLADATGEHEQSTLARALVHARGWLLTHDEVAVWQSHCKTDSCRGAIEDADPTMRAQHAIAVDGPIAGDEGRVRFRVNGLVVDGLDALLDKLDQYPRGTRLAWFDRGVPLPASGLWRLGQRDATFEDARSGAARLGIVLVR